MTKAPLNHLAAMLLSALIVPTAGFAAVNPQVNASLSNFQLRTVDLTPNDNIAAGYQINSQSISYENGIMVWPNRISDEQTLQPGQTFDSALTKAQFSSAINGNGVPGNVAQTLIWDATQPDPGPGGNLGSTYTYNAHLTLAAGSALILSGTLMQQYIPGGMHSWDIVQSFFDATLSRTDGSGYQSMFTPHLIHYGDWNSADWNNLTDFSVMLTNFGTTDIGVNMGVVLYAGMEPDHPLSQLPGATTPPLSPVPEPASYAMLGAGLAMLAGFARRRRIR